MAVNRTGAFKGVLKKIPTLVYVYNVLNFLVDVLDWWDRGEFLWEKSTAVTPVIAPLVAFATSGLGRLALYGLGLLAIYLSVRTRRRNVTPKAHKWRAVRVFSLAVIVVAAIGYLAGPQVETIQTFTIVPPRIASVTMRLSGRTNGGTSNVDFLPLATVDGSRTKGDRFKELFGMVLVVRMRAGTASYWNDPLISRSRIYEIPDGTVEMNVVNGGALAAVTAPQSVVEFYLLCVPRGLGRNFMTIAEGVAKGGAMCSRSEVALAMRTTKQ